MSKIHVPNVKLNNGLDMPLVGFGLWKVPNESAADIVYNAIKTGYRLFDGAADYGNEKECGDGIQRALKEGIVKREELFIVSKLWQTFHDPEQVEPIVKKQLADYGIDYFDLYVIHFPLALKYVDPKVRYPPGWFYDGKSEVQYSKSSLESTWHAMEDLTKSGLSKSIGVSNYTGALLLDLFAYAKIMPATLQIEHHPYFAQPKIVELAQQNGVTVTGYSSFGPQSFVDGNMQAAAGIPTLFDHSVVKKIADAHGKTTAQVLLRWATQRGIAVIPKSSSQGRLESNLDVCSFDLKKEEVDEISGLDQNLKFNKPSNWGVPIPLFD